MKALAQFQSMVQHGDMRLSTSAENIRGTVRPYAHLLLVASTTAVFLKHIGSIRNIGLYFVVRVILGVPVRDDTKPGETKFFSIRLGIAHGLRNLLMGYAMLQLAEGQGLKRFVGAAGMTVFTWEAWAGRSPTFQLCSLNLESLVYSLKPREWV